MKEIAIYGAGGFGLEVAMLVEQIADAGGSWRIIGFFDDGIAEGSMVNGYPVLGGVEKARRWPNPLAMAVAVGKPATKRNIVKRLGNPNLSFPTLVHPSVIMGRKEYVRIGRGCIVCAGCIVTTNISIGEFVILNLACTVGHETVIGNYSSFMPTCNISGEVRIGDGTYWGTGAKIINRVSVGNDAIIGAGAVVIVDVPEGVTAVGVPARKIETT